MGKRAYLTVALGVAIVLSAIGVASSAEKPVVAASSGPPITFSVGFTPKALPERTRVPAVLHLSGQVQTTDGSQPPALREFVLELDRNTAIDVSGFPTCTGGSLDVRVDVNQICPEGRVGKGSMAFSVAFPEQPQILADSEAFVFSGDGKGGTSTLYLISEMKQPITTQVVTTVKITKIKNGRYGTRAVATVPVIAGGAGAITSFHLVLNRGLRVDGEPFSILDAKCPDGRLKARTLARFDDGTEVESEVTRSCTGRDPSEASP